MLSLLDIRLEAFRFTCHDTVDMLQMVGKECNNDIERNRATLPRRTVHVHYRVAKRKISLSVIKITDDTEKFFCRCIPAVPFKDADFTELFTHVRNAYSIVCVTSKCKAAADFIIKLCKSSAVDLSGPQLLCLHSLLPHNRASIQHLLNSVPRIFELVFHLKEEEVDPLVASGFFTQARMTRAKAIHLVIRKVLPPLNVNWDAFVQRLLLGLPGCEVALHLQLSPPDDDINRLLSTVRNAFQSTDLPTVLPKIVSIFSRPAYQSAAFLPAISPTVTDVSMRSHLWVGLHEPIFGLPADVYYVKNKASGLTLSILNIKKPEVRMTIIYQGHFEV